jgi:hypothetical protein
MLLDLSKLAEPYSLKAEGNSYTFTTESGNQYLINFKDTTADYNQGEIGDSIIYEYQFYRTKCVKEAFDERVGSTVLYSLNEAIRDNNRIVIYFVCDSQDEREYLRHRLFNLWYKRHGSHYFHILDGEIKYEGGTEYCSVLIKNENPNCGILKQLFTDLMDSLKQKNG